MCVSMQRCVCAWHKTHHADSFFPPSFFLSLVPLMNNDLIVDCGVKCQLSVCVGHVILTGEVFLHHFTASPFVFVKGFICFQWSSSPQQEPLRKLIDHSHFSCCAADILSIRPNYSCFHCNDWLHMCIFSIFQMHFVHQRELFCP